jgi:hypothetical protein
MVVGHLLFVNTETLASIFTLPPDARPPVHTLDATHPFRQGWAPSKFIGTDDSFVFTMGNTLRNQGSVNRCSVASVQPSLALRLAPEATPLDQRNDFTDAPYQGEVFFVRGTGSARVVRQETTLTEARYTAETTARLVLNQNYHQGWWVELRPDEHSPSFIPAFPHESMSAVIVPAGEGTITFRYRTPLLGLGMLTTALGLTVALTLCRAGVRRP